MLAHQAHSIRRCQRHALKSFLSAQITLKNPWAKVIDTITAKSTGSSDLSDFVVCYPEHLASRIALIKVGMQLTPTACCGAVIWAPSYQ